MVFPTFTQLFFLTLKKILLSPFICLQSHAILPLFCPQSPLLSFFKKKWKGKAKKWEIRNLSVSRRWHILGLPFWVKFPWRTPPKLHFKYQVSSLSEHDSPKEGSVLGINGHLRDKPKEKLRSLHYICAVLEREVRFKT